MDQKKWNGSANLGFKFLSCFASFWELEKIEKLSKLGYILKNEIPTIKNKSNSKQERINALFIALEYILEYRKDNPQDFDEILVALEKFCEKRKFDATIDENIGMWLK